MSVFYQILCTGTICCLSMSTGLLLAWPSSTIRTFKSENTTLSRPFTETEVALFGSLSSIGALVGTPVIGFFLDRAARKTCAVFASMNHVIAWSLIATCEQVEVILLAIFIAGAGGAVMLVVPVFVAEICQESIRGAMTSGSMIFYGIGMLLSYLLGGCLGYKSMIYVCMSLSASGVAIVLMFLKETPMFLLKKGLEVEAAQSFAFYRNAKLDSKEVQQEMEKLKRAFNPQLDDELAPEEERLRLPDTRNVEKLSLWKFIKKSRSTRRAMFLTLTLMTSAVFQGLIVVQVYAEPLFSEAVPNISPTICSVIFAIVVIVVGFVAAYLTELAGRRLLMMCSAFASGLCCVALGSQLQFHWAPHWVTAVFIYLFATAYTCGAGTVPFVLVAELFLPEVKSFMSMFVVEWAWLCSFVILFIFNPLVTAVGLGPVFYLFAGVGFLTAGFCFIYLHETKGLPVDAIQALFSK